MTFKKLFFASTALALGLAFATLALIGTGNPAFAASAASAKSYEQTVDSYASRSAT